jgi:hypothetical protein
MESAMKSTLLLSSALLLALSSGAFAQSASPQGAGTSVGPATGRPDMPPEPPAAKVQQPGKEGQQAQNAAPGDTGTSVGPATGTPDTPTEPPAARFQQPGKETAQTKAVTGQSGQAGSQARSLPDGAQQGSGASQQGMNAESGAGRGGHVTTTHELKQALQDQGFSDVRILAESFVVQAMKDGKRVTMMLGPNGLSAYQIVDENALNEEDMTGSVAPGGGTADGSRQ